MALRGKEKGTAVATNSKSKKILCSDHDLHDVQIYGSILFCGVIMFLSFPLSIRTAMMHEAALVTDCWGLHVASIFYLLFGADWQETLPRPIHPHMVLTGIGNRGRRLANGQHTGKGKIRLGIFCTAQFFFQLTLWSKETAPVTARAWAPGQSVRKPRQFTNTKLLFNS